MNRCLYLQVVIANAMWACWKRGKKCTCVDVPSMTCSSLYRLTKLTTRLLATPALKSVNQCRGYRPPSAVFTLGSKNCYILFLKRWKLSTIAAILSQFLCPNTSEENSNFCSALKLHLLVMFNCKSYIWIVCQNSQYEYWTQLTQTDRSAFIM